MKNQKNLINLRKRSLKMISLRHLQRKEEENRRLKVKKISQKLPLKRKKLAPNLRSKKALKKKITSLKI